MGRRKSKKKTGGFGKKLLVVFILFLLGAGYYAYSHPVEARQKVNDLVVRAENAINKGMTVNAIKTDRTSSVPVVQSATIPPANQPVITVESKYDNLSLGVPGKADTIIDRPGYALGDIEYHEQPAWVVYHFKNQSILMKGKNKCLGR